jgi:hypothetical protein
MDGLLYDIFQAAVVGALVLGCALYCVFTLAPKALVLRLKSAMLQAPLPAWVRARLQASMAKPGGCGACDGCASGTAAKARRRFPD